MQQATDKDHRELFENEFRILQKISLNEYHHANIMQVKELYTWKEETKFQTIYHFAIVMNLEKGSLQDVIDNKIALTDD